jgi:hypothetical protein
MKKRISREKLSQKEKKAIGSNILASVAKNRLALVFIIAIIAGIIAGVIYYNNKDKPENQSEKMQIGQYYEKQLQCYQDGDCPDDAFCGPDGLCKTGDLLLTLRAPKILGRGRASEGDVNRVSLKTQGQ